MKKILGVLSLVLLLVGCSSGSGEKTSESEKVYKIGILQFAQHPSLDNCREGFLQGLEEEGFVEGENLEIDYQNAQADMGIAAQIAD
ncbi:MAG: ABC transporter substrate binding protein, partial [Anaerococcus vaginalis]|uniref:ABC transporter substrate binding protein n=1 Tax=Anaerococcus vaginalis TaxID=33037 RepID=UPI0029000408